MNNLLCYLGIEPIRSQVLATGNMIHLMFPDNKKYIDYFKNNELKDQSDVDKLDLFLADYAPSMKLSLISKIREIIDNKTDDLLNEKSIEFNEKVNTYILNKYSKVGTATEMTKGINNEYQSYNTALSSFNLKSKFKIQSMEDLDIDAEFADLSDPIESSFPLINKSMIGGGGYLRSSLVTYVAPAKAGKTFIALQESLFIALKGRKVHYLTFSDMTPLQLTLRLGNLYNPDLVNKIPKIEDYKKVRSEFMTKIKNKGGKLLVTVAESQSMTPGDYIDLVKDLGCDVYIIDYDYDFNYENSESLYMSGEYLYKRLAVLAKDTRSVVIVFTQTNKEGISADIVSTDHIGGSVRKGQISSAVVTLSLSDNPSPIPIMKLDRNRLGTMGDFVQCIRSSSGQLFTFKDAKNEDSQDLLANSYSIRYDTQDLAFLNLFDNNFKFNEIN